MKSRIFATFVVKFLASLPLAEIFEKVSFDPYKRITRLSARKSERMTEFLGDKNMPIPTVLNTKIRLTKLCLSGFELYSRRVPLTFSSQ